MHKQVANFCAVAVILLCGSNAVHAQVSTYVFDLDGAQEVGPGDPDGAGTATVMIDANNLTVDWNISVSNIDLPLTGAHIHAADAGINGGVIVNFGGQLSGSGLTDPDLADVLADPTGHYINLHNAAFPGGAIRGQFTPAIPEPGLAGLFAIALSASVLRRSRDR